MTPNEVPHSPLKNVLHGHDDAIKQAFYNTAAGLFVLAVCGAAFGVYCILETFIRPLMWAVLCGTFLHPFKDTLTVTVNGWLKALRTSGTPLVLGTVLLPFEVIDKTSDQLSTLLLNKIQILTSVFLGLPTIYILYHFGPLLSILHFIQFMFSIVYEIFGYFNAVWIWSIVIVYVLTVIFYWNPESSDVLRKLSLPVWMMVLMHIVNVSTGYFRIPVLLCILVFLTIGFFSEVGEAEGQVANNPDGEQSESVISKVFTRLFSKLFPSLYADPVCTLYTEPATPPCKSSSIEDVFSDTSIDSPSSPGNPMDAGATNPDTQNKPKLKLHLKRKLVRIDSQSTDRKSSRTMGDRVFIPLLYALVLVRIWKNLWILQLLPILLLFMVIKKIGRKIYSWKPLNDCTESVYDKLTSDSRIDIIAPKPIRGLVQLLLRGDSKIIAVLERGMSSAVSVLIIVMLLVGAVLMAFFMVIQVHRESVHLVSVTSDVLNKSIVLHPELSEWLPDTVDMQHALDAMAGKAYLYGREWIVSKVQGAFNSDSESKVHIQEQILSVWDKIYESWFTKDLFQSTEEGRTCPMPFELNGQTYCSVSPPMRTPTNVSNVVTGEINAIEFSLTNMSSLWSMLSSTDDYNSQSILNFVQEHIGVVMSVLESVWLVLKGNVNLAFSLFTVVIGMLLGGGSAILNFIVDAVVFLTTLFYLLSSSGDVYKPMEWLMNLTPGHHGGDSKLGKAVEEAIASVFRASLKMAIFYGLYTWLTHMIFDIQIVFIPSLVAACFGAIPFVGTYVAAIPAIVELWLVNGEPAKAGLLLLCHLLPTYFVDTAIYSDIKGGHPYLTGLAIVGGMYWLGLEGAIIGPILLCCLIVAINVYTSMLHSEADAEEAPTPTTKWSLVKRKMSQIFLNSTPEEDVNEHRTSRREYLHRTNSVM